MRRQIWVLILLSFSVGGQASLINIGAGMIYDDVNNLTWLQDANYAKTTGYDADGRMTWVEANAWASNLVYAGKDDWRLPSLLDQGNNGCDNRPVTFAVSGTDCGFNVNPSQSELAYLFSVNLGNRSSDYVHNPAAFNTGPFLNIQHDAHAYWTANQYSPESDLAWMYFMNHGLQVWGSKQFGFYAWAVRSGKVDLNVSGYSVQMLPQVRSRGSEVRYDSYAGFDGLLNDQGQVAGVTISDNQYAVIWANNTLTDTGVTGYPIDINNKGQVAITAGVDAAFPEAGGCLLWSGKETEGWINLGSLGGGCWVTAMNAAGQVTGISQVYDGNGIYRGNSVFLWSKGTMTNLDAFDNEQYSDDGPEACKGANYLYNPCPTSVFDFAVDINDLGQVLFIRQNRASKRVPNPPAPGPVVWTNGKIVAMPQSVSFQKGKSLNNRGHVLGYLNNYKSLLIWNVNDGSSFRYDADATLDAKLNNQGEVFFSRTDDIYKLTQDRVLQPVVKLGDLVCTSNTLAAVNDQGNVVGSCDGVAYVNQQGRAIKLSTLVSPDVAANLGTVFAINAAGQILTSTSLLTPRYQTVIASCDVNQDAKINQADLTLINAARYKYSPSYDIDGDGKVTMMDLRKCTLQCL